MPSGFWGCQPWFKTKDHLFRIYFDIFFTGKQRQLFINILEEARAEALKQHEGKTLTFSCDGSSNDWRQFGQPKSKRPLESVILDEGVKENIVRDVREFSRRADWYRKRGIPYRRGYLLHGPPGNVQR